MNKITKRLLSMLAVLALVLTMAPAGILAVETKADSQITPGQANLPAGIAEKQAAGAAKQAAAKAALAALEGTDAAARLAELNEELTTCPFCGQAATWVAPSASATNDFSDGTHYYIYGTFSRTYGGNVFTAEAAGTSACILMDNATIDMYGGRILQYNASTLNIGGTGTMYSSLSSHSTNPTYSAGLFSVTTGDGTHELNLYGGTFYANYITYNSTKKMYFPVILSNDADNTVNIWTDDVVVGPAAARTDMGTLNVYISAGAFNMYGGTIRNGYSIKDYEGWNLFLGGGTANIYGGTITGGAGTSTNGIRGGNAYVNAATFNMYGGTISNGSVLGKFAMGGNVSAMSKSAVVNIQGGTIEKGAAPYGGGNINAKYCSLTIGGTAKIADGKNSPNGANIHFNRDSGTGTLYIGGNALVTGGTTTDNGGSIYLQTGEMEVSGNATVTGGTATGSDKNGGNIYVKAGTLTVKDDATVTLGTASGNGGNIWVASGATVNINDGTVSEGTAVYGGNLFANGTFNVGAAEIKDGKAPYGGNIAIVSGTLITSDAAVISGGSNTNGYSSYGGNIFLRNAKTGTLLKGTISGGTAANGGNIHACAGSKLEIAANVIGGIARYGANVHVSTYTRSSGSINLTAAVEVVISGGEISGGIHKDVAGEGEEVVGSNMMVVNDATGKGTTLTLKGDADIEDIYFQYSGELNKLIVDSSWTGEAGWDPSEAIYCGESVPYAAAAADYTGTLTNLYGNHGQLIWDGETGVKMVDYEVICTDGTRQGYKEAADAVAAANGDMTKRLVAAGDIALNGETVVVDGIGEIAITGAGTVYGMDQSNDGFKSHSGVFTIAEGITVASEVIYNGKHYIAITGGDNGEKYTFHRVETELTNVTVNVDKAGLYYKAQYKFDEIVKDRVVSYGILLNLNEAPTEESLATSSGDLSGYADTTLTASSHGVYGIFKDGKDSNLADGKTKVFGNPYLAINTTGEELDKYPVFTAAEATGKSLADAMELANTKWEAISEDGKPALQEFFAKWLEKGAWDEAWAAQLTNINPAEA